MKAFLATAAACAALTVGPAYADCSYPTPPAKIPDGNTASMEEMVTAQKAIKEYDKAINAYMACIKLEFDAAVANGGEKLTPQQKADMGRVEVQKHNAAYDQLQSIATRFNEQVRAFKAKNDKKS
jgi:hypothetical protein